MYVYAHNDLGCKGTKKKSYMQIYEEKSAEFVDFARDLACFGGDYKNEIKKGREK